MNSTDEARTKAAKRPSRAVQLKQALKRHRALRFAIQALFFLLAPGLFSSAFAGAKYVASQLGSMHPVEMSGFVVTLLFLGAFTVLFGRFFCGYACAFGFVGDVVFDLASLARKRLRIKEVPFPEKLVKALQLLKYLVLALICCLCFLSLYAEASSFSPWTAFAGIIAGNVEGIRLGAFIVLAALVLGMALRKRFFCQFLCPMGAIFALLPVAPFSQLDRNAKSCPKSCGICHKNCPVSIWPNQASMESGECISCGECTIRCPRANIAALRLEGKPERKPLSFTGFNWKSVLLKAALLLLGCWFIGDVRFLPSPQEVLPWAAFWA